MKTNLPQIFLVTAGLATGALTASAASDAPIRSDAARIELKRADRAFIERATKDALEEIEISRVAAERTSNPKVREFAQMVIADHESANETLASIATNRGVSLPAKGTEGERWAKKNAKDFDLDYLNQMISAHENAVRLFAKEGKDGEDAETVAYARKILPKLQSHLEQATDLKKSLK